MKKKRTRRLFPETFATIQRAKLAGLLPQAVWLSMVTGVKQSGMAPSCQAASLATYQEYITEIYGKRATAFLRDKAVPA